MLANIIPYLVTPGESFLALGSMCFRNDVRLRPKNASTDGHCYLPSFTRATIPLALSEEDTLQTDIGDYPSFIRLLTDKRSVLSGGEHYEEWASSILHLCLSHLSGLR